MEEKDAVELLRKYAPSKEVLNIVLEHSRAVLKVALRVASRFPEADTDTIRIGCMLHDIGRFDCPPGPKTIFHGIRGGEILRSEGLETFARIAENHLGSGITKDDIERQGLPLPKKDFVPTTIEEKIITYADNLIAGTVEKDIDWVIERYRNDVDEQAADRIRKLHEELRR